jgi:long-chain acyl-CoA synthetase
MCAARLVPPHLNAVALFDAGERETPTAPAMHYFDTTISFADAATAARALARALIERCGVREGDRVALMLQNVPAVPIALHAIWLAGGVGTPLNVMYQTRELTHQLNDSGARVVICLESLYERVTSVRGETEVQQVVTVSELDDLTDIPAALDGHERIDCPGALRYRDLVAQHHGASFPSPSPSPSSPALLMYTSGTTGVAKGAITSHGALTYNAEVWRRWYHLESSDVAIAIAPLFHITGLMGHLVASRAAGGPLVLFARFNPAVALELIERWKGTWALGPLTAFVALLEHPDFATRDLRSVTKVASGGAPVAEAVVERFERATGAYIHNAYGLTETTSAVVLVPFGARAPIDPLEHAVSVGVCVDGAESRIVSVDDGSDVATGQVGELLLRGPMLASGYWNRPDETAEAFRDGWFHTGDLAKRDADGWHWIVDRVKDVIIASGFKVWPREVEDVLFLHPAIAEASVIGVADAYRGETVRAYVVFKRGQSASTDDLTDHCRRLLAAYKVPRTIEVVDEIPKTASGKVLRRELRERARAQSASVVDRP